jgi:uncharacterized protein YbbC (DUF1343 family)
VYCLLAGVDLVAVLAPEHGFRGDRQAEHGDEPEYVDPSTGLTVYSVYRRSQSQIRSILLKASATCVLADLQDAGTRLYTFGVARFRSLFF